jgi:hypothetical protein
MESIPPHAPNSTERPVAWGRGETDAFDRLVLVRDELRRISHRRIGRERPGLMARGSQTQQERRHEA